MLVLFHLGGGWYFADQLQVDALVPGSERTGLRHRDHRGGTGNHRAQGRGGRGLRSDRATGSSGIDWGTGYGHLGEIVSEGADGSVVRSMTRIDGDPPEVGMLADIDGVAFPGNPDRAFGLSYTDVQFDTPLGAMNAWEILAPSSLWVDTRSRARSVTIGGASGRCRSIAEEGYPQLVINYRNDPGEPADPSGYYRYGQSEWEDVAGAVAYAVSRGAEGVVLVGYSTGAAHILSYLYRTPDSPVRLAVLDSPNIDFEETVDLGASQRELPLIPLPLPGTLVWTAKRLSVDSVRNRLVGHRLRQPGRATQCSGARLSRDRRRDRAPCQQSGVLRCEARPGASGDSARGRSCPFLEHQPGGLRATHSPSSCRSSPRPPDPVPFRASGGPGALPHLSGGGPVPSAT